MYVNQSIQRPQGVNVFGSRLIRVEPDYASLKFSVSSVAQQPREAFEQTGARATGVRKALARCGVAEPDVRSSRVSMNLAFEGYGESRRSIGYCAARSFDVLVRDLTRVEEVLIDLVDAGAHVIDSVSYKTSRLRELRAEARKGAVEAALSKAEVYASAAGLDVGKALHIEDINPEEIAQRSHMPDVDLAEHDEADAPGADGPGSIVVAAAVMVCFALVR